MQHGGGYDSKYMGGYFVSMGKRAYSYFVASVQLGHTRGIGYIVSILSATTHALPGHLVVTLYHLYTASYSRFSYVNLDTLYLFTGLCLL